MAAAYSRSQATKECNLDYIDLRLLACAADFANPFAFAGFTAVWDPLCCFPLRAGDEGPNLENLL